MSRPLPSRRLLMSRSERAARTAAIRALRTVGAEQAVRAGLGGRVALKLAERDVLQEAAAWNRVKFGVRTALGEDGPVVVGPWLSEVGFEVLYWVPFLRWLTTRFDIDPQRLHVVSRGGVGSWYGDVAAHYHDIFDAMTPDAFRQHTEGRWADTGGQKQMTLNRWDREILDRVGQGQSWRRHAVLHPSLMYQFFRTYWKGTTAIRQVERHTDMRPLPPPTSAGVELPSEPFVAVKFYFRPSFPDSGHNRRVIRDLIAGLSGEMPVVVLNTGLNVDDHADAEIDAGHGVTWPLEGVPPARNLHVQSVAISRAQAFVGTYGGLSYLAPLYGVPSIALYSDEHAFLPSHLDVARRMAARNGASLTLLDTAQLDLVRMLATDPEPVA